MQIPVERIGDVAVAIIAVDELDASNVADLKRDMAPILEANTKMVVDLSRMRFIDSSGMGAMLSCLRQLSSRGGDLKLFGMSKQVRGAFELVRLHRIFDIFGTRDEAVRAFQT
jgi:anti-sigma B factor antagonist